MTNRNHADHSPDSQDHPHADPRDDPRDQLLSPAQAAAFLHTTPEHLERLRELGTGPDWGVLTRQTIRYSRVDLEVWRTRP